MPKQTFVALLSTSIQEDIQRELLELGLSHEDIERALNSRLGDLDDTIDITKYLNDN